MSQQINLYNPLFLKKEKLFSTRAMAQALGLVALGLVGIYAYSAMQAREAARLAQQYAEQVSIQRAQLSKLTAQMGGNARSKVLESEVSRLETAVKSRQGLLDTLTTGQLGNSEGISRYFAAFGRQATPGVWLTGFVVGEGGNELRINGRVLHPDLVPVYLRALNQETVMRGRQVTEMKLTAKEGAPARGDAAGQAERAGPAEPARFVAFSILAPLRAPEPEKAPSGTGKP
jgi:hypothetical protein